MRSYKLRWLVITAVFTALCAVTTIIIAIPLPESKGFVNFGDIFVLLAGLLFGPVSGMTVGALGGIIADLIYAPYWAPVTLIVKGLEGLTAGLLFRLLSRKKCRIEIGAVISLISGAAVMLCGYFFGGWLLVALVNESNYGVGLTVAIADLIGNGVQAAVSAVTAYAIYLASAKIKPVNDYLEKLKRKE